MRKTAETLLEELARLDSAFMAVIYALNIILELGYCFVMLAEDYSVSRHPAFFAFYAVSSGAIVLAAALLIAGGTKKKRGAPRGKGLLLALAVVQVATIGADILYAARHGELWDDGYIFLIAGLVFIAVYLRRYLALRMATGLTSPREEEDGDGQ